eukprot:g71436.t1
MWSGNGRKYFIETYGCQMNVSDSEVVIAILEQQAKLQPATDINEAQVILLNTCAIRENAETKIWNRLRYIRSTMKRPKLSKQPQNPPTVVVLGCMAERLKVKLLEEDQLVDVVVGPDAYRDLPRLLQEANENGAAHNTLLSLEETYADIRPVRTDSNGVSAFVSIMRGCDNMCTFCIVPYTRGRERSRDLASIVEEVKELSQQV